MNKGALGLSIIAALFIVLALHGLEERARVDLPNFKKYPHWIFAQIQRSVRLGHVPSGSSVTMRHAGKFGFGEQNRNITAGLAQSGRHKRIPYGERGSIAPPAPPLARPVPRLLLGLLWRLYRKWFVYCANCGQELVIMTAPRDFDPFPPSRSWQGTCPECGTVHTYQPNEVHLGEE